MRSMPSCKGINVLTPDEMDAKIGAEILEEANTILDIDPDAAYEVLTRHCCKPPTVAATPIHRAETISEQTGDHLI